MKKTVLSLLFLLLKGILASGQTTATDFTATDCSAISHTLSTELNAGKVVVLVWVMPCANCISDAKAAFDAVQSFTTSNPGKVLYWLCDDVGNSACSAITSWAAANGIHSPIFDNAGNVIDQSIYGGLGMPHVVVIGGSSKHIFYNQLGGSGDGVAITNAINVALTSVASVNNVSQTADLFTLFPNPTRNGVSFSYVLNNATSVNFEVCDFAGRCVKNITLGEQGSGLHTVDLNFENKLAIGYYFLKLNTEYGSKTIKFTVTD
jgi:hypothetical protein